MLYQSTRNASPVVPLKQAILRSLPPDNGLYLPQVLPTLPASFWSASRGMHFHEIGHTVAQAFFGEDIPAHDLQSMVSEALSFDAPIHSLSESDHVLELFHGPTLAFKDFGARFMARLMAWLTRHDDSPLTILAATSGDTGGAVASAFHGVPGTQVVILYPKGKVSLLQEKQLTTLGDNITALEIDGTFDDCQSLVKFALLDADLMQHQNLTSANSINLARLVPQSFYYIHAAQQLDSPIPPAFSIPSGNFGNLTAGILAHHMGLPNSGFIAATNANDVVPQFLLSGRYEPRPSIATLSNAMDVGAPSNFARLSAILHHSWPEMRSLITGFSASDSDTLSAISEVFQRYQYIIDPHGAIAWLAAQTWRKNHPNTPTISLETAHPAKFADVMPKELGTIEIPERLAILAERTKIAIAMDTQPESFKSWLLDYAR